MSKFLIVKLIVQPVLRVRISMQLDADEKLLRECTYFSCVGLKVEILASPSN